MPPLHVIHPGQIILYGIQKGQVDLQMGTSENCGSAQEEDAAKGT